MASGSGLPCPARRFLFDAKVSSCSSGMRVSGEEPCQVFTHYLASCRDNVCWRWCVIVTVLTGSFLYYSSDDFFPEIAE